MAEYVKIRCCGDCIQYNWKKHKCRLGATEEGKAQDHFYRDCPLGIYEDEAHEKRTETHVVCLDMISRQAAIDAINNADFNIYDGDWADFVIGRRNYMTKEEACAIIDGLPPAQPERKRGRWIVRYECPNCGEERSYVFDTCPMCGAKMERSDNGSK